MRRCYGCKIKKPESDFNKNSYRNDGLSTICKVCNSILHKEYYKRNINIERKKRSEYQKSHPEMGRNRHKKWESKDSVKVYRRKYRSLYRKNKRTDDIKFRLKESVSGAIRSKMKRRLLSKNNTSTFSMLPYTVEDLIRHLESLFLVGMTWDNYGEWHIDHIIPDSHFKYTSYKDEEFQSSWRLSNLQPLWAIDNIKKGSRI